jgi:hypothetical protein
MLASGDILVSENRFVSMLMLVAPEMQVNRAYSNGSKNIQHGDVGPCPVGV